MKKRFVVDGHYHDSENGSITSDFIAAVDSDKAALIAINARGPNCNGWELNRVVTFEEYIAEQNHIIAEMVAMSISDVQKSWFQTTRYLTGKK